MFISRILFARRQDLSHLSCDVGFRAEVDKTPSEGGRRFEVFHLRACLRLGVWDLAIGGADSDSIVRLEPISFHLLMRSSFRNQISVASCQLKVKE